MASIAFAVGIRYGSQMMRNRSKDVDVITRLLDRIPSTNGGTADVPGSWSTDPTLLIPEVSAAILTFQTANHLPIADGVVDPGGHTLALMSQLAGIVASIFDIDAQKNWAWLQSWVAADPSSLDDQAPLEGKIVPPPSHRFLVSVDGSSIKWFGVVVPLDSSGGIIGGQPHIFFTPGPWQHNPPCRDSEYDEFSSVDTWLDLWDEYTSIIGSQLAASFAPQVLVIPFYKNSQFGNLGTFLSNWRQVVSAVIGATIDSIDPLFLRNEFDFTSVFCSSFSNGIYPHMNFNTAGVGADAMTRFAFDMDGQASKPRPNWRPSPGAVYSDTAAPATNPVGTQWFVGGRFSKIWPFHPEAMVEHALCRFLLLHGLTRFGR